MAGNSLKSVVIPLAASALTKEGAETLGGVE